jgi:hypothetical protein
VEVGSVGVAELDELLPGPELGARLAAIDSATLSIYDRIVVLRAHQRMVSHHQAASYREMDQIYGWFADQDPNLEFAFEGAVCEISSALHLTRRSAEFELELATDLHRRLPQVGDCLRQGRIDLRRARAFARETCHLEEDVARQIANETLERASRSTAGQLEALLRRQCLQHDPQAAAKRYRAAVEERQVVLEANETGTAHLHGLDLPPDLATRAMALISALAEAAKTPGDSRTIDQRRADVFLDLLLGSAQGNNQGVVNLHIDLDTLTRLAEHPGELAGYGPIIADIARQVAEQQAGGQWRWTLEDQETGQPLTNGITRRRPTTAQRRRVEATNPTCIFPGCRTPATTSDIDHRIEYAKGGRTHTTNLGPLCEYHHGVRHDAGWSYERLPDADYLFTSPTGHQYTTSGRSP